MATYEGNWPIAEFTGDYCTIQMPASKRMLKISNYLVLYFRGITKGTFPIVSSGSEKGKPTLIYTPEKDGAYGVGVGANEGSVEIGKYSEKSLSGKLNAKGVDENGQEIIIKAEFINIRNNNLGD
jgi:hypothetical protein